MSSHYLTTRRTQHGLRYVVRYRLGGRSYPVVHAGSFATKKEATERRNLVAGELAACRNPADVLNALLVEPPKVRPMREWLPEYQASRRDHAESTAGKLGSKLR